jgi:hypothetical protein
MASKPTIKEIEEYMAGYNMGSPTLPDTIPSANEKQVSGKHYKEKIIQPWDYIYANNLGYFEGNCVKYVSRWRDKGGIDNWGLINILQGATDSDYFGHSVALDDDTLAVGAPNVSGSGAVYIFRRKYRRW